MASAKLGSSAIGSSGAGAGAEGADLGADFKPEPLALGFVAAGAAGLDAVALGGLFASGFSACLFTDAVVGFIIRSKNELSFGLMLFLVVELESRDVGLAVPSEALGAVFAGAVAFGRDGNVVFGTEGTGGTSASCFALDAAVGASRWDGTFAGFVTSRGLGLAVGDVFVLDELSAPAPERARDAAVGAVRELLLGFLSGALCAGDAVEDPDTFVEVGVLGWLAGDLTALEEVLGGAFVDIAAGLPLAKGFFASTFLPADFADLRSSETGGSASPPLTASSLAGSAGFRSAES